MAGYSNIADLSRAIREANNGKLGGANIVQQGRDIKNIIRLEAGKLLDIINRYIDQYYIDYANDEKGIGYSPSGRYQRTFGFKRSLQYSEVNTTDTTIKITLFFDEQALHPSLFNGEEGFVPILINQGWRWHDKPHTMYHFSHFEPYNFLGKAIAEYNAYNPYGITIHVHMKHEGRPDQLNLDYDI